MAGDTVIGRPTVYKPEYCNEIIELGRDGKSAVQMASALGIHKDTLYQWVKEYPAFSDAYAFARQLCQVWWENHGQTGLTASVFNSGLWIRQMACRFPAEYRETSRQETQALDKHGNPTDPQPVSIIVKHVAADTSK